MSRVITKTDLHDIDLVRRGKVRDVYSLGDELLIITTDRMSAYDVIMLDAIPGKGKILNSISSYWFRLMEDIVPHHMITANISKYPEICFKYEDILDERSMLVKKTEPLPVECIVRGYLSGSGWESYKRNGTVCDVPLPSGMQESERLTEPLFTPSTKAEDGEHDINISFDEVINLVGIEIANKIRDYSLAIYNRGYSIARDSGIIIADTKFEFGLLDGELLLIDEVLTPDSSRFWSVDDYQIGVSQKSFDKQYLRDYLNSVEWNKEPPPPRLPDDIISNTYEKYKEARNRIMFM